MYAIRAEFIKLKRSMSWVVVVLLPVVLVLAGSLMSLIDGNRLEDGWHTLWLRSFVFYGLFPLSAGIAILASLVWRVEHRGSNWNALSAGPTSSLRIVVSKTAAIAVLATVMQLIAVATVVIIGVFAFGLPGFPPWRYLVATVMIIAAAVPVAAFQSFLSMRMRSFAGPVLVAFLAACASSVMLVAEFGSTVFISPYATLTRATQLGTATFADTGTITGTVLASLAVASIILTAAAIAVSTVRLERGEIRT